MNTSGDNKEMSRVFPRSLPTAGIFQRQGTQEEPVRTSWTRNESALIGQSARSVVERSDLQEEMSF